VRTRSGSFEIFYEANYDVVRRSLSAAFGDPVLAEEAVQEAFARAYVHWPRVDRMDRPAGWVYVVAVRFGLKQQRRSHTAETDEHADDIADGVVTQEVVRAAIDRLPARQRIAIVLRYLVDLPLEDVASAMDCALGTVKSTLHTALARLQVELDEESEEVGHDAS
jgi:RNA polymerase sigma-70 factor (ECF subfamily)